MYSKLKFTIVKFFIGVNQMSSWFLENKLEFFCYIYMVFRARQKTKV
jgi:hypothetical protein